MPMHDHKYRDPFEMRDSPRAGVDLPLEIYSTEFPEALSARTRDVGLTGLCATTASPFAAKSIVKVCLDLPHRTLQIAARGIWQQLLNHDNVVTTGVAFMDIPEEAMEGLWNLIYDTAQRFARFIHTDSELRSISFEGAIGLAQVTRLRNLEPGAVLFREGKAADSERSLYLIEQGAIDLEMRVLRSQGRGLERLERGALVGGIPLVAGSDHPETAIAVEQTRLLEVDARSFAFLVQAKPWLAQQLRYAVTTLYAQRLFRRSVDLRDTT